jgi:biopolymer transport protein ExbB/TolQ
MAGAAARRGSSGGSFFLGLALSAGFFGLLSTPWLEGSSLRRYCMAHDVEKVAVVMFFWGLADLLVKARSYGRQKAALRRSWLPHSETATPVSSATDLLSVVEAAPARLRNTWIADRIRSALLFVQKRGTADRLDDHVRQLGDTAADRSHASFALVRIIAWMIPILGFLGTVVGITIAVANVSPNQLDSSLSEVTSGLAMAFDATAVALALAMMLMFAYYLTERTESRLLHAVDDAVDELLLHRFARDKSIETPFAAPIEQAISELTRQAGSLIDAQAKLWADALAKTAAQTNALLERHHQAFALGLTAMQQESERQAGTLHASTQQLAGVERALAENARFLASIVEHGSALAPLQSSLVDNLTALRQTQGLDDALHSLTAAIHLMTARARSTGFEKAA